MAGNKGREAGDGKEGLPRLCAHPCPTRFCGDETFPYRGVYYIGLFSRDGPSAASTEQPVAPEEPTPELEQPEKTPSNEAKAGAEVKTRKDGDLQAKPNRRRKRSKSPKGLQAKKEKQIQKACRRVAVALEPVLGEFTQLLYQHLKGSADVYIESEVITKFADITSPLVPQSITKILNGRSGRQNLSDFKHTTQLEGSEARACSPSLEPAEAMAPTVGDKKAQLMDPKRVVSESLQAPLGVAEIIMAYVGNVKRRRSKSPAQALPAPASDEKASLTPSWKIFKRIQWDPHVDASQFTVCYMDRFKGMLETPFLKFAASRDVTHDDFMPWHRVWMFKCRGAVVWDREKRIENWAFTQQ